MSFPEVNDKLVENKERENVKFDHFSFGYGIFFLVLPNKKSFSKPVNTMLVRLIQGKCLI